MRYYASPEQRDRLIAGFRALADFLEENPAAPAPRRAHLMVFPSDISAGLDCQARRRNSSLVADRRASSVASTCGYSAPGGRTCTS
jgi:hypothetical protein